MTAVSAGARSWGLPSFVAGCFAVSATWDVLYSVTCKFIPVSMVYLPVPIAVFAVPILFCAGFGFWAGEWNKTKSMTARVGAAAWCVVIPNLAYVLLLATALLLSVAIKQQTLS
jgi:hypothetical protein